MPSNRIPRGYAVYHKGVQELMEGQRPTLDFLGNLRPAPWLPVSRVDTVHDDPQVIPAGTVVGRICTTDHNDIYEAVTAAKRTDYLVPAWAGTGEYTLTYGANDVTYLTPDIDDYPTVVAAAGISTLDVPAVKPLGIATYDMYASHLGTTYKNYDRQSMVAFLSWGWTILIPVRTPSEADIQVGDLVQVEDNGSVSSTWTPTAATNIVGRMKPWESGDCPEFKIGKCVEKITLATQPSSVGNQLLSAAISASNYASAHNFSDLNKVQTVVGLGLTGSGTAGIPASLLSAVAQSQVWYALVIQISAV